VRRYLAASYEVFGMLAEAAREDRVEGLLRGPVAQSGFSRLT